ncbi:questin oxidase family protein [Pseudaquabacterium pictum]|uniref:DUF4243 domain-containing protein n=1 Tax=Pseudaquabacterium pictum TaxID=2315236 RepID=A0A480AUM7_9BURK|nr:questin oxidase family protein [Rubrivivax pictus]GCL65254.1 hypothetical protein AQPW35_43350 [Rubrivivax pictus]
MSLAQLLDAGAGFAPEFGDGLSNHLPMALVALKRLGAGDARLQAFADGYATRLQPAPPSRPWPAGDPWTSRLGDPAAWPAYRSLFAEWLANEGSAAVLEQVLPMLMPGCGAAAFHGLIRTAYALQAGHAGELADGLACWAARHLPLGPLPARAGRQADPLPLLRRLPALPSDHPLIFQRMQAAAASPALQAVVAGLAVDAGTLQRLARLGAQAHAGSGNFTALHLVTSAHAMRVLLPFADDPLPALRWYWQAWVAAVAAAGLQALPPVPLQPWRAIVAAALASDDDHLIKLVDSCRAEEAAHGGTDWQLAASRALAG